MSLPWGTVGWSLFNQGWFKSRAVSSRKQEQRVSTLGLATTLGFICKQRRMRVLLRSTYPFFFWGPFFFFAILATSKPATAAQLQMMKTGLKMIEKQPEQQLQKLDSTEPPPVVRDKRVLDAAKMYEKYFLGQMMKAMRSTVHRSDLEKQSMGEGIYRDQLDDQYVDTWGERGGIGLADMIHDELIGKAEMMKMRRAAMKAAKGKVRTPMALTDRDVLKVRKLPGVKTDGAGGVTIETVLVSLEKSTARPEDGPESVRSPWTGKITKLESADGKVVLGLETAIEVIGSSTDDVKAAPAAAKPEPARKVELAFDGVAFQVNVGDIVQAGQTVGHLGKSARGILLRQTLVQEANRTLPSVGM